MVVGRRRVRSRRRAVARGAAHDRRRRDRHQRRAAVRAPGRASRSCWRPASTTATGRSPICSPDRGGRRSSRALAPGDRVRRVLDLRTGRARRGRRRARRGCDSVRFSSLARPGIAVLRADVDPPDASDALVGSGRLGADRRSTTATAWMATRGTRRDRSPPRRRSNATATRLDRIAAYVASDGRRRAGSRAARGWRTARADGFDALLAEHRRAWSRRWERADVRIDGDEQLQLEVRARALPPDGVGRPAAARPPSVRAG